MKICDIEAVAEIAHQNGARLVVDNTFASPYLCQPLNFGADFTVHSATKYLSGHADAMGGIVVSNEEFDRNTLVGVMKLAGGVLSVWEAHQILRGVKTLGLRLEKQCANAEILAAHLSKNPLIEKVYYPNLADDKSLTRRILRGDFGGALVSIQLKVCVRATSLGDVYTLVSHSASSSHRELSPKRRAGLGIGDGLVRISVGIEDVKDIIEDIKQALS